MTHLQTFRSTNQAGSMAVHRENGRTLIVIENLPLDPKARMTRAVFQLLPEHQLLLAKILIEEELRHHG